MRIKYFFVITFLLTSISLINAQHTVNFNKYGLFIVENGVPTEIKTEQESLPYFFEDYLILKGVKSIGFCIYNIRTKAITKWVYGYIFNVELKNNILFVYFTKIHSQREPDPNFGYRDRSVVTYWKWELDTNTLKTKNETQLQEDPFPEISNFFDANYKLPYGNDYLQRTKEEKLSERKYRYYGSNFYLDINYGPDIDLTGKYYYDAYGGKKDIFVVGILDWDGR